MNDRISVGANKGIYTTQEYEENYTSLYNDVEFVRNYAGDSVLYTSRNTWFYLEDQKKNASFSAWTSGVNETSSNRLVQYYELDKQRLPDIVYCSTEDYNSEYSIFAYLAENAYKLNITDAAYIYVK